MTDELVKRLLSLADCDARSGEPLGKCMREAASSIKQLERELSISRMAQVVMDNGAEALEAENARLRAAIETISYYNTVGYTDMALDAANAALIEKPVVTK